MKADNLLLLAVGAVLVWIGWSAWGPAPAPPASTAGSPELRAAIASGQPVLVDFYADWCGPCKAMKPAVQSLAAELRGKLQVVEINVDQNREISQHYGVTSIPCFVLISGGREVKRQVGGMPKSELRKLTGL